MCLLLMAMMGGLAWFHHNQLGRETVAHGGMNQSDKEHYRKLGVDCLETYTMQGYEATETIFRMFTLNQHDFYSLNPGMSATLSAGDVICIRGMYGLTPGGVSFTTPSWFWPAVAMAAAGAGFFASRLMTQIQTSKAQPTLSLV